MSELFADVNGRRVGMLRWKQGEMPFAYAPEWLESTARRPLSQSLDLSKVVHRGPVVENDFANLLPDNPDAIRKLTRAIENRELRCF